MSADACLPDGTPLYIKCGRANGKTMLQLEIYEELLKKAGSRPIVIEADQEEE